MFMFGSWKFKSPEDKVFQWEKQQKEILPLDYTF
jgi:hypothetical protein